MTNRFTYLLCTLALTLGATSCTKAELEETATVEYAPFNAALDISINEFSAGQNQQPGGLAAAPAATATTVSTRATEYNAVALRTDYSTPMSLGDGGYIYEIDGVSGHVLSCTRVTPEQVINNEIRIEDVPGGAWLYLVMNTRQAPNIDWEGATHYQDISRASIKLSEAIDPYDLVIGNAPIFPDEIPSDHRPVTNYPEPGQIMPWNGDDYRDVQYNIELQSSLSILEIETIKPWILSGTNLAEGVYARNQILEYEVTAIALDNYYDEYLFYTNMVKFNQSYSSFEGNVSGSRIRRIYNGRDIAELPSYRRAVGSWSSVMGTNSIDCRPRITVEGEEKNAVWRFFTQSCTMHNDIDENPYNPNVIVELQNIKYFNGTEVVTIPEKRYITVQRYGYYTWNNSYGTRYFYYNFYPNKIHAMATMIGYYTNIHLGTNPFIDHDFNYTEDGLIFKLENLYTRPYAKVAAENGIGVSVPFEKDQWNEEDLGYGFAE